MKKVLVYFHTHWDREWYKTRVAFNFRLVKVIDDVLVKLQNKELPCFYFDGQTSALIDYLNYRPEKEDIIKKFIKEKKLFIGPFFCSTDSFLVSIQSLLSNIDMGIEYSKEFGQNEFLGYCADTFGHSKDLPIVFNYYNFDAGLFWRGLGNLPCCFDWNGSKSIYLRQGYFHDYLNSDLPYFKKAELIENQLKKIDDDKQEILLLPLGADHLKVADNVKYQIEEINKFLKNYELVISNPFEYVKSVSQTKKISDELRDSSRNFLLPGVFSSRIDIKQKNAYSQWELLRIAEPMNALCFSNNCSTPNYQPFIDAAKKELIKNHAHDSIYGCSTDDVHKDMEHRFSVANQTSKCVIDEILNEISDEKSDKISVINLSDYNYSGLCEIRTNKNLSFGQLKSKEFSIAKDLSLDINRIPVTEDFEIFKTYLIEVDDVKPFVISNININKTKTDLKITDNSIENSNIKLSIKNNKIDLTDKKKDITYKNFVEIVDYADVGDSYNSSPIKNDKKLKAEIIKSKVLEKGDLSSTLRIETKILIPEKSTINKRSKKLIPHRIITDITLDKKSDFIKFNLSWVNKSINHILKVSFNFKNPVEKTFSDDLLNIIERKYDYNYDLSKQTPAEKGIELKTNSSCAQTYFSTQGISVITKGLNEYTPIKNNIELTILRSTGVISNPKNPARGTPAGPPIVTKDLFGLKENHGEFAIVFDDNEKKIEQIKQNYYGCAFAFFGNVNKILLKTDKKLITAQFKDKLKVRIFDKKKGQLLDL